MSDRLIRQLTRVTRVQIPSPPDDFKTLSIPKQEDLSAASLKVGDQLLIEVPDYILHPSVNFDLHRKWNHNIPPIDAVMQAVVLDCMGKMIQVDTMGYDLNKQQPNGHSWTGWLPRASIKVKTRYGG